MIIDFLIVFVVILSVAFGFRRGFTATLLSVVAFGLSIIITLTLFNVFSEKLLETEFGEKIQISVSQGIEKYISDASDKTIEKLPFLSLNSNTNHSLKDDLHKKSVEVIISLMLLICAYIISKLAIFLLRKILHIATGLPIIHTADSILGGVCGMLIGLIWVAVIYMCSGYFSLIDTVPILKSQFNSSVIVLIISDIIL